MANRQDDHAPLDDFFSGFDKDEKKPSGEKADTANKLTSHIQPSTRSGILSLLGTRKPAARKGHNVAMQPEALEVRQVLTTTTNPLAAWQNAAGAPADAIGNLNPYPNAFMYDINISPDGTRLATAGSSKEIHIINVQSGQIEKTLIGHSSLVMEVDFSPDGTKLVSASYDKTARIWDVQSGTLLQTINLPQLGLRVDWSPRGDMVAIGVHVNVTQLYNVATGAVTSVSYPGNTEAVIFDFTEDGNHILHTNGTNVTMHDTATGTLVKTFTGVNQPIYSVDVDPTGTYVAAGTLNGKVLVWDMATGTLKSDQSIHVGGSVKSVQFMTGGSPHLVSADYTSKIIVQNIEGLASGNPLVEVKRYIVPNPDSIVASKTGGEFFVRTGDNTGATYITAYDAPDPPAPVIPEPEPELPVYGPEEAEETPPETENLLMEYATQTMDDLRASIETDSSILPELQRRNTERERELALLETAITPARASVANAQAYVQSLEAEIDALSAQYTAAVHAGDGAAEYQARRSIDKKIPIRAHAYAALAVEQNALQALLDQKTTITAAMEETAVLIDVTMDRLRTQTQEYATWASLNGESEAAALVAAEGFISTGLQNGYNTMSHVRMSVNVLDKQMGSTDIAAHFLPQNITEIQEHPSPVLTKSGGLLKIFGRVMNTGNRAGEITVHIGGTSDRFRNMPDQYTISVYLNPGEYRDFVSTVLIPAGESSTGSVRLTATTPDEESIMQEVRNREPRSMNSGYYVQGEGAVLHNARVIAMTEGIDEEGNITNSSAYRLQKYLAANPTEAGSIARKIEAGVIAQDDFTSTFLVAEGMSRTALEAKRILLAAGLGMNTDDPRFNTAIGPSLDIKQLGIIQGKRTTPETIWMFPRSFASRTFTLTEDKMVNFWINSHEIGEIQSAVDLIGIKPNLSLMIKGKTTSGYDVAYDLDRGTGSGESISLKLSPGSYTVTVKDCTDYSGFTPAQILNMQMPHMKLGMDIRNYDNREIIGRISIPESEKTMQVSLRVAEFEQLPDQTWERKLQNDTKFLNANLPVWVVIHGMNSDEKAPAIVELANQLSQYESIQVVTIDWEKAAHDGIITQDAQWTPAVGKWAAQQLIAIGFHPSKINIAGWSHGTYVANALAQEVDHISKEKQLPPAEQQINTLVALDPAGNWPLLSGFEHTIIDFKEFSRNAVAIESSWMAGSNLLAGKADLSLKINSVDTASAQVLTEHAEPVFSFANILKMQRLGASAFSEYFSLQNIMNSSLRNRSHKENAYYENYEFILDMGIGEFSDSLSLRFRDESNQEVKIPLGWSA